MHRGEHHASEARVGVGLFGNNGHQILKQLAGHPQARLVAVAGYPLAEIPRNLEPIVQVRGTFAELLADPDVEIISFCSPFKDEQGEQIIRCLEAGKHAYAEKPCCMSEAVLDRIIQAARRNGRIFHEMAGTAFTQPYATLRELVASGIIGEVVQVFSQKSYPWTDWRPADEREDGGLALQAGVYCARFAEHVAGLKISSMSMRETRLGNPDPASECRRAASFLMEFSNGGVGSAIANYCCPATPSWPNWGYETLRIFGTEGFVESIDGGRIGTLAVTGREPTALDFAAPGRDFFDMVLEEILTSRQVVPFDLEAELSPTRWVIRAKQAATMTG